MFVLVSWPQQEMAQGEVTYIVLIYNNNRIKQTLLSTKENLNNFQAGGNSNTDQKHNLLTNKSCILEYHQNNQMITIDFIIAAIKEITLNGTSK